MRFQSENESSQYIAELLTRKAESYHSGGDQGNHDLQVHKSIVLDYCGCHFVCRHFCNENV